MYFVKACFKWFLFFAFLSINILIAVFMMTKYMKKDIFDNRKSFKESFLNLINNSFFTIIFITLF